MRSEAHLNTERAFGLQKRPDLRAMINVRE